MSKNAGTLRPPAAVSEISAICLHAPVGLGRCWADGEGGQRGEFPRLDWVKPPVTNPTQRAPLEVQILLGRLQKGLYSD